MAVKWMYDRIESVSLFELNITVTQWQTTVSWVGDSYIPGIGMLIVHVNGVFQIKGDSYTEVDGNTIEFVPRYLKKDDVVSIKYIPNKLSLGDIRVAYNYSNLVNSSNPVQNEVALVTSSKKFYIYNGGIWEEFAIPYNVNNLGVMFLQEKQDITDNTERTYTLNDITYNPDTNSILIFVDGVKIEQSDYIEVDNSTITFNDDLPVGSQEIEFLVANQDSWEETNSHTIDYGYNTEGDINSEIVKQGVNVVKNTTFSYDLDGNIVQEIVVKGGKTIVKDYTYTGDNITNITVTVS